MAKEILAKTGPDVEWEKRKDGNYSIRVPTAFGKRTINLKMKSKHEAVQYVRSRRVQERATLRRDMKLQAAFTIRNHKATFEKVIPLWVKDREGTIKPSTIESYVLMVKQWLRFTKLTDELPSAATVDDVRRWINEDSKVKLATRNARLAALTNLFDWLCASAYCGPNPPRIIGKVSQEKLTHEQKESKRKVPFTLEEIQKILTYCDDRIAYEYAQYEKVKTEGVKTGYDHLKRIDQLGFWKAAVVIGRHTGLRLSDVSKLEWASVSTDSITVWTRKRDARVELPAHPEMKPYICSVPSVDGGDARYVFPDQHLKPIDVLSSQFACILKGAGITGKSYHCLRSTCAIDFKDRLIAAGKSEAEAVEIVAKLLGHSNSTTTKDHYL